jgi:hypothetical protein
MLSRLLALTAVGLLLCAPLSALAGDRDGDRYRSRYDGRYSGGDDDSDSDRHDRYRDGDSDGYHYYDRVDYEPHDQPGAAVPEPGAALAFGAGLLVVASRVRRRRDR